MEAKLSLLKSLAQFQYKITDEQVRVMIRTMSDVFRQHLLTSGFDERKVRALITKFRDAGRRSAPWRPASGRVPGRPQDGADGNRQNRWLFEEEHKFYASEINATLVEVKYFLQSLSMASAPPLPANTIQEEFIWLTGHKIEPGVYRDPIQLIAIDLVDFLQDARSVQSGHLTPLDRGGRHIPENTFLMLYRSNQLQGNLTLDELITLMETIVTRHRTVEPDYLQTISR